MWNRSQSPSYIYKHLELLRDVLIPEGFPVPLPPDHPVYTSHTYFRGDPVPGKLRGAWMAVRPAPTGADPGQWQWVCLRCLSEVEWAPYYRAGKPSRCRGLDWLADRLDTLDPVDRPDEFRVNPNPKGKPHHPKG